MGPISRWAVNKPKSAIAVWVLIAFLIVAGAKVFGGAYNNSFTLPDTESSQAQTLLGQIPGAKDSLTASTSKIVWSPATGTVKDPTVVAPVTAMLTTISQIPGVACIVTPYGAPMGTDCPKAQAGQSSAASGSAGGAAQSGAAAGSTQAVALPPETMKVMAGLAPAGVSTDGKVAYATVTFKGQPQDLSVADGKAVLAAIKAANTNGLQVGANGQALEFAGVEPPSSETIGITVALVILLLTFGSLVGAFLPIISAVLSLAVGQALVLFTARFLDVATFAPTLAAMIGLGVGIDYSLFVMNRYKQALDAGREPRAAALESVRTSGRAVLFAAITVVIALLGLFVLRINFFNGLAVAASATVIMMMVGATLLLPAVLSLLGRKAFAIKMPWARKPKAHNPDGGAFARYGRWLQRNYRWFGAIAFVVLLVIALPATALRLGFTDDSGKAPEKPARVAYDLVSQGFGPGINGPFVVAVQTSTPGDNASVQQLAGAISKDPNVAAAIPYPMGPTSSVTAMQVIPKSSPQSAETTDLLNRLRTQDIPSVTSQGKVKAYVGGTQAITSDFTTVLTNALPVFLSVVIGLSFIALVLLFRSLLVPLTGAVTSLLSLAAAMGVTVAVFQWGWLANIVGISGTGPIMPFLPIMVFAILFGLSMDYQVFLVSRMQEEWGHTSDNNASVRRGLAASGRVVAIAAAIMFSVFGSFVLGSDSTIKLFGLSLASAVLFDAFIVRLVIVPSLMYQIGNANWWMPKWLGKILPKVEVESEEDLEFELAEIDDIPDADVPTAHAKG
ncbi:MAG: MMPL family transporter [Actinomycetes bacterium]